MGAMSVVSQSELIRERTSGHCKRQESESKNKGPKTVLQQIHEVKRPPCRSKYDNATAALGLSQSQSLCRCIRHGPRTKSVYLAGSGPTLT